jgi:hypothetical protein
MHFKREHCDMPHSLTFPIAAESEDKSDIGRRASLVARLSLLASVIEEGFIKAQRYQALSRYSDRELARIGLTYQELPHFVMFGRSKLCNEQHRSSASTGMR